jgi:hypothetical protein
MTIYWCDEIHILDMVFVKLRTFPRLSFMEVVMFYTPKRIKMVNVFLDRSHVKELVSLDCIVGLLL